jgi:hypothetical protein
MASPVQGSGCAQGARRGVMGPDASQDSILNEPTGDSTQTNLSTYDELNVWLTAVQPPPKLLSLIRAMERSHRAAARPSAAGQLGAVQTLTDAVAKLTARIDQIAPQKPTPTVKGSRSYAAVTAHGVAPAPVLAGPPREKHVPTRYNRELLVRPGNESPQERLRRGPELLRALQGTPAEKAVVAARRLPSNDIVFTVSSPEACKKLVQEAKWVQSICTTAQLKRREYVVLAHGIARQSIPTDQQAAIAALKSQNPTAPIEILRTGWSRKAIRTGKTITSLHISVAEPEQLNWLVDNGLLWGSQVHDCEPFFGDCQITQCFNCYRYGHVVRTCRHAQRCGFCAGFGHVTNLCPVRDDREKHRCAVCTSPMAKHTAWSRDCPTRQEAVAKANAAYEQRPTRLRIPFRPDSLTAPAAPIFSIPEHVVAQSTQPHPSNISTNFGEPTDFLASQISTVDDSADEWTAVTNQKKRSRGNTGKDSRKRGRPKGTTLAAKQNHDIRTFHVPDAQFGTATPLPSTQFTLSPSSSTTSSPPLPANI